MPFKFIFIFLLCFGAQAEEIHQSDLRLSLEEKSSYCDFGIAQKNYNTSDLLECIDKLAFNVVSRQKGLQKTGERSRGGETYREIAIENFLTTLLNGNLLSPHQASYIPPETTSSYYQSNYPVSGGTFDLSTGLGLNLFNALSSISRYDDYKCVPRILCEVASGKLPGRSFGKQTSGFLENIGGSSFMEWLSKIDIAGTSPVLNFARAMVLGYSQKGNSAACYRAFPKCPTNPQALVYYLNNYNGGFFRFFNKFQGGYFRDLVSFYNQKDADDFLIEKERRKIAERVVPVLRDYGSDYRKIGGNKNRLIFPDEKVADKKIVLDKVAEVWRAPQTSALYEERQRIFSVNPESRKPFRFPSSRKVSRTFR